MLTTKVKKLIIDSIYAAKCEGNENVYINYDGIFSIFSDNISVDKYKVFDAEEAENFLFDYTEKQFNKVLI